MEMTQLAFPAALRLGARIETDPEIAGQQYVVCTVQASGLEAAQAALAWEEWHRALGLLVPAAQAGVFCLSLELVN
jgi:hypothetical protein